MRTKAAVLRGLGQDWDVVDIEVDAPKTGEIIVEWKAAGLCHSDEHMVTGDMVPPVESWGALGIEDLWPMIGGHEGAGVVVEVGPNVGSVAVGDHVAASFVPSCGRCRYCSTGRQNLCDAGGGTFLTGMITDGTSRHRIIEPDGAELNMLAKLGTFAHHTCVAESQVVKVEPDLPLEAVALVSCGVATGFGSATERAGVRAGDTAVIVGVGGIGINAVQGAAIAGAKRVIAIDPLEFKREKAMEMGATHTYASMEEAFPQVQEMTWGQMADQVIMSPGVLYGEMMELGTKLAGKGGTIVVTGIAPMTQTESSINLFELAMWNKEIKGTIFGSLNPRADIPRLLGMYREGQLKLDELITKTYPLDEINEGYRAMRDGENIRGVILHG
ncbi:NDMA-dependent alcohol dehydrogenase [Ilumatobacter sp.]|uniref:NDMA-dependent alcohol dehydrogenase n=1 Tax=Ilumatobacter sp. TaxID=1967498 RepID=UPI003C6A0F90